VSASTHDRPEPGARSTEPLVAPTHRPQRPTTRCTSLAATQTCTSPRSRAR
jgi:hypothetical protein